MYSKDHWGSICLNGLFIIRSCNHGSNHCTRLEHVHMLLSRPVLHLTFQGLWSLPLRCPRKWTRRDFRVCVDVCSWIRRINLVICIWDFIPNTVEEILVIVLFKIHWISEWENLLNQVMLLRGEVDWKLIGEFHILIIHEMHPKYVECNGI